MNLFQQMYVLVCNFFAYWNVCNSKDKLFKNGKVKRKSVIYVLVAFYSDYLLKDKPKTPVMATRDVSVTRGSFAPVVDYDAYDSPAYTRFTKLSK